MPLSETCLHCQKLHLQRRRTFWNAKLSYRYPQKLDQGNILGILNSNLFVAAAVEDGIKALDSVLIRIVCILNVSTMFALPLPILSTLIDCLFRSVIWPDQWVSIVRVANARPFVKCRRLCKLEKRSWCSQQLSVRIR